MYAVDDVIVRLLGDWNMMAGGLTDIGVTVIVYQLSSAI